MCLSFFLFFYKLDADFVILLKAPLLLIFFLNQNFINFFFFVFFRWKNGLLVKVLYSCISLFFLLASCYYSRAKGESGPRGARDAFIAYPG